MMEADAFILFGVANQLAIIDIVSKHPTLHHEFRKLIKTVLAIDYLHTLHPWTNSPLDILQVVQHAVVKQLMQPECG